MTQTPPVSRKTKILIADDHVPFRRVLKSLFSPSEVEIVECSDGYEALARYGEHRPDWVIMDFDMSPMDGLTATEAIRKQYPGARIILITLHDGEDIREAVRKAGAAAYVRKENLMQVRDLIKLGT